MAAFTQAAIRQTFLQLLDTTPLDKITVKMIVDHCGVSRNTFYYHYEDIPALLRDVLDTELQRISREAADAPTLRARACHFLTSAAVHRQFFDRVYHSEYKGRLQQRLLQAAMQLAADAVNHHGGQDLDEAARKTIASFFAGGFLGICTQWLRDGAQEPPEELVRRMGLFEGLLQQVIDRARDTKF